MNQTEAVVVLALLALAVTVLGWVAMLLLAWRDDVIGRVPIVPPPPSGMIEPDSPWPR